ncbi:MAG: acyl-CoA thioesterase [Chloroflexi bacterium]|nr:acyl-CoA thioesterase [Chloroflexota bacterium]
MEAKRVSDSSVVMAQVMTPQDVNIAGNVHGGVIMKLLDTAAGVVAYRHARTNVVTATIDRLDFHHPVYVGDFVTIKAGLNLVGRTSMEIGVQAETENLITGKKRHTASANITMVAIGKDGSPAAVPPLILETDEEKQRNLKALARREARLREMKNK